MAVTNLTGYTWIGDNYILTAGTYGEYAVEFTSNSNTYTRFYHGDMGGDDWMEYNTTQVFNNGWLNSNYKTVLFTGGTDVTDTFFITWLEENGTLTPPPGIANKLLAVNQVKQDIKVAIENKGADLTGVEFDGYAEKITDLPAVVELTQSQYDALSVYDNNTYYLIVEG